MRRTVALCLSVALLVFGCGGDVNQEEQQHFLGRALAGIGAALRGLSNDGRMLDNPTTGRLGNSQQITFPPNPNDLAKVRLIDAGPSSDQGKRSAETAVVSIGMVFQGGNAADVPKYNITALLTWGSGTGKVEAQIDVMSGVRVTLPASTVNVDIIVQNAAAAAIAAPPTATFGATIAYGSAGKGEPATLTIRIITIANALPDALFPIPAFAKEMVVLMDDPTSTCSVTFPNSSKVNVLANTFPRIPIPGTAGGTFVTITNTSGVDRKFGILYFLDL